LGGLAPSNLELALLKQYPFDSAVQRMTVVAKKKGTPSYSVFIKGAPEKVASLCRPNTSMFCILFVLWLMFARDESVLVSLDFQKIFCN